MTTSWEHLTDGELRARLENRGMHPEAAEILTRNREMGWAADRIEEWLRT